MYPYYTYWDPTYILVVIGAVISMIASANVKRSFQKNSRVYNQRGLRAEQVAEMILRSAGITDVSIRRVSGDLTDHYDPSKKVVNLSDSVYGSTSVSCGWGSCTRMRPRYPTCERIRANHNPYGTRTNRQFRFPAFDAAHFDRFDPRLCRTGKNWCCSFLRRLDLPARDAPG